MRRKIQYALLPTYVLTGSPLRPGGQGGCACSADLLYERNKKNGGTKGNDVSGKRIAHGSNLEGKVA